MEPPSFRVACLCGAISQLVPSKPPPCTQPELTLCHCDTCRHSSGLLFVSYRPITTPGLHGLSEFIAPDGWARYFCSCCGCHIFRCKKDQHQDPQWELATGVIIESLPDHWPMTSRPTHHIHVSDTTDGGGAVWFSDFHGQEMQSPSLASDASDEKNVPASCACGRVNFHLTRPNPASYHPKSNFADLIHPYCATDQAITQNPKDEKWWIRADGKKYLSGTCACRSCRLASGFEVQVWAFVPRANIFFHVPSSEGGWETTPLDFDNLPSGILRSYNSSSGVLREFCGTCGATVFWHDKWRPDLIDVSVGLLKASEGARAESWLDWCTQRVSFAEDAEVGRVGSEASWARALIDSLGKGLSLQQKTWA